MENKFIWKFHFEKNNQTYNSFTQVFLVLVLVILFSKFGSNS